MPRIACPAFYRSAGLAESGSGKIWNMRIATATLFVISLPIRQSIPLLGQTSTPALSNNQLFERAYPCVGLVLAGGPTSNQAVAMGSAFVARADGVLLTALHVGKNASSLQVRFR